jgi:hypothetical protein
MSPPRKAVLVGGGGGAGSKDDSLSRENPTRRMAPKSKAAGWGKESGKQPKPPALQPQSSRQSRWTWMPTLRRSASGRRALRSFTTSLPTSPLPGVKKWVDSSRFDEDAPVGEKQVSPELVAQVLSQQVSAAVHAAAQAAADAAHVAGLPESKCEEIFNDAVAAAASAFEHNSASADASSERRPSREFSSETSRLETSLGVPPPAPLSSCLVCRHVAPPEPRRACNNVCGALTEG